MCVQLQDDICETSARTKGPLHGMRCPTHGRLERMRRRCESRLRVRALHGQLAEGKGLAECIDSGSGRPTNESCITSAKVSTASSPPAALAM